MADKIISADALSRAMYHEAFETDSDMQRWDSGCWIRYKMFENALKAAPAIEAEPIKHGRWIAEGLVDGNQNRYCRCSECGKGDTQAISQRVPYCWWCGAKMDGGESE